MNEEDLNKAIEEIWSQGQVFKKPPWWKRAWWWLIGHEYRRISSFTETMKAQGKNLPPVDIDKIDIFRQREPEDA